MKLSLLALGLVVGPSMLAWSSAAQAMTPGCVAGQVVALHYPPYGVAPDKPLQEICHAPATVALDDLGGTIALLERQLSRLLQPTPTSSVDRWADCAVSRAIHARWAEAGRDVPLDAWASSEAGRAEETFRLGFPTWARQVVPAPELTCTLPNDRQCGGTIQPLAGETVGTYQVALGRAWRHWGPWWPEALRGEVARAHVELMKAGAAEPPAPAMNEDLAKRAACSARGLADELVAYHAAFTLLIQTLGEASCERDAPPHAWGLANDLRCRVQATVTQMDGAVPTLRAAGSLATAPALEALANAKAAEVVLPELRTQWQQTMKDVRAALAAKQQALADLRNTAKEAVVAAADAATAQLPVARLGPEFDLILRGKGFCLLGQWRPEREAKFSYEIVLGLPAPGVLAQAITTEACTGSNEPVILLSTGKEYVDVSRLPNGRPRFSDLARDTRTIKGAIPELLHGLGLPAIVDVVEDSEQTWTELRNLPFDRDFQVVIHFGLGVSWLPGSNRAATGTIALGSDGMTGGIETGLKQALGDLEAALQARLTQGVALDLASGWVQVRATGQAPKLTSFDPKAAPPRFQGRVTVADPMAPAKPLLTADIELGLEQEDERWRLRVLKQNLGTAALMQAARDALKNHPDLKAIEVTLKPFADRLQQRGAQLEALWNLATVLHAEIDRDHAVTFGMAWRVPGLDGPSPPPARITIGPNTGLKAELDRTALSKWAVELATYLAIDPVAVSKAAVARACTQLQQRTFGTLRVEVVPPTCGSEETPRADVRIVGFTKGNTLLLRNVRLVSAGGGRLEPSVNGAQVLWGPRNGERSVDGAELQEAITALVGDMGWVEKYVKARLAELDGHTIWFRVSLDLPYLGTVEAGRVGLSVKDGLAATSSIHAALQSAVSRAIQDNGSAALSGLIGDKARITNVTFVDDGVQLTFAVPIPDLGSDLTMKVHLPSGRVSADAEKSLMDAALNKVVGVFAKLLGLGNDVPKVEIDTTQRPVALAVTAKVSFSGLSIQLPKLLISQRGVVATWPVVIPFKGVQINIGPFAFIDPALHLDGTKGAESLGLGGKLTLLTQGLDLILHMDTLATFGLRKPYELKHAGHTILFDTIPMFVSSGEIFPREKKITSRNRTAGPLKAIIDFGDSSTITDTQAEFGGSLTILGVKLGKAAITLEASRKIRATGAVDLLVATMTMEFTSDPFPEKMRLEGAVRVGVGDFRIMLKLVATENNVDIAFGIFGVDINLSVRSLRQVTPKLLLDAILALFDFKLEDLLKLPKALLDGGSFDPAGKIGDGGNTGSSGDSGAASSTGGASKQPGIGHEGHAEAQGRGTGETTAGGELHHNQIGQYALYHVAADGCVARALHSGDSVMIEGLVSQDAVGVLREGSAIAGRWKTIALAKTTDGWSTWEQGQHSVSVTVPGAGAVTVPYDVMAPGRTDPFVVIATGADAQITLHAIRMRPSAPCSSPAAGGISEIVGLTPRDLIPGWQRRAWAAADPAHQFDTAERDLINAHARAVLSGAPPPSRPEFGRVALPTRSGDAMQRWLYRWRDADRIAVLPRSRSHPVYVPASSFLGRWLMAQEGPPPPPGPSPWWSSALDDWRRSNAGDAPASGLAWQDVVADGLSEGALPASVWPESGPPFLLSYDAMGARDRRLWWCASPDACASLRTVGATVMTGTEAVTGGPLLEALVRRAATGAAASSFLWTGRSSQDGRVFYVVFNSASPDHLSVAELDSRAGAPAPAACGRVPTETLVASETRQPAVCRVASLGTAASWENWLATGSRGPGQGEACINPVLRLKYSLEAEACQ